jgi:Spy/CpxP family protein refolding chaperone
MQITLSRSWFAFALIGVICCSPAFAADAPPATERANPTPAAGSGAAFMLQHGREIVGELKLTDEQKAKVDAIFKTAKDDLDAMKSKLEALEPRERMAEARQFLDDVRNQVAGALDETQKAELDKKLAEDGRVRARQQAGADRRSPATRPAARGNFVEQLTENLAKLDLSDEQKAKVRSLMDDARQKGQQLREEIRNGGADAREKARELFAQTREQLSQVLSAEQRDKLRDLMQGGAPGGPMRGPNDRPSPASTRAAGPDMQMQDSEMQMDAPARKSARGAVRVDPVQPEAPVAAVGPVPGDAIPDLALRKLDGSVVQLSSLKGRIVVLEFGSYSCPSFRNRVAAMEKLKGDYATRAQFFVVYAREAHPAGEWEVDRNKDDGITVEQPKTIEARKTLASTAREKLKITVPIVMDSIGNDAATALGARANSAYVIGRDGTLVARQEWFEPSALRRVLEAATARPALKPAA